MDKECELPDLGPDTALSWLGGIWVWGSRWDSGTWRWTLCRTVCGAARWLATSQTLLSPALSSVVSQTPYPNGGLCWWGSPAQTETIIISCSFKFYFLSSFTFSPHKGVFESDPSLSDNNFYLTNTCLFQSAQRNDMSVVEDANIILELKYEKISNSQNKLRMHIHVHHLQNESNFCKQMFNWSFIHSQLHIINSM